MIDSRVNEFASDLCDPLTCISPIWVGKWSVMNDEESRVPGWVASKLEASHVARVKARVERAGLDVPEVVGGYHLSNIGVQLLTWWFAARKERAMPCADDVDMRSLLELSPYMEYASWEGPEEMRVRLYGSALAAGGGHDRSGEDLFQDKDDPNREANILRLKTLQRVPCGVVTFWTLHDGHGRPYLIEAVTLPVAAGADGKDRVISTFMPVDESGANLKALRWEAVLDTDRPYGFSGEIFIDTGMGLPEGPHQQPDFL